jgi:phage portal protein BeeE
MSKIEKLNKQNKTFLKQRNLKLKNVALFFGIKETTLLNSTAKNRYVNALRLFAEFINK